MNAKAHILNYVNRAEQILRVVYPLTNDPKVLIDALKELQKASPFLMQLNSPLNKEKEKLIEEIETLLEKHQNSAVEFSKDKKFVICSDQYDLTPVSSLKVDQYIKEVKRICQHE